MRGSALLAEREGEKQESILENGGEHWSISINRSHAFVVITERIKNCNVSFNLNEQLPYEYRT